MKLSKQKGRNEERGKGNWLKVLFSPFLPFSLSPFLPFSLTPFLVYCLFLAGCAVAPENKTAKPLAVVQTLAGTKDVRFGEVFGIVADKSGAVFVSDGANGKIWKIDSNGAAGLVTDKLDTPSNLALDKDNLIVVADSGSHTIKKINPASGEISLVAGIENKSGFADGAAAESMFNAPIGVAVVGDKIYVADSYNDKIRVVENGNVRTIAENLNTPCGIAAAANGEIYFADAGNGQIKRIETNGAVSVFAGTGERETKNGTSSEAGFIEPVGISIDANNLIYVADAGANAIRVFGRDSAAPVWETLSGGRRGLLDGELNEAKFNRPTAVAINSKGEILVADSANKLIRGIFTEVQPALPKIIDPETAQNYFVTPAKMRETTEPRWTYVPADKPREIAGTFGEIRGNLKTPDGAAYFHNGLDIVGGYGETARFVRDEKILRPLGVDNFGNLRESLRTPLFAYVHINIGREADGKAFDDARFLPRLENGKIKSVRIRRGTKFVAGDAIGTLNAMNHVHLTVGETGWEMNALASLNLPGISDTVPPKIEKITLFAADWQEIKSTVSGKIRIVARAFDQMNGNVSRRRLGVFRLGFQVLDSNGNAVAGFENPKMNISFERLPETEGAANRVFAVGSASGATGETIFNYIVTNFVQNGAAREEFLDTTVLPNGDYKIRVFAADFFGNQTTQDLNLKIQN